MRLKLADRNLLADVLGIKPEYIYLSPNKKQFHYGNVRAYLTKRGVEVLIKELMEFHRNMET